MNLFPSGFNTPPLWGVNTGGVGDLLPHKRNAFKVKSSIPAALPRGFFIAEIKKVPDIDGAYIEFPYDLNAHRLKAAGFISG
jgi:hypothetical protein